MNKKKRMKIVKTRTISELNQVARKIEQMPFPSLCAYAGMNIGFTPA